MSSKIYFSEQQNRKSLSYYAVKMVSGIVARIAPSLGKRCVQRLLLTPVRHQSKVIKPNTMKEYKLNTQFEQLHIYALGDGPIVLFTHGWSGSTGQFYPLMEKVAALGFKVIAFDHYAHGNSAGKEANLPLFVRGLEAVKAHIDLPIVATISHSMGSIAALNRVNTNVHILIAPPFDFYTGFEQRILATGISKRLFNTVIKSVESQHDMIFENLLPEHHLAKHKNIVIVHDLEDKFAFHHLSEKVAKIHSHLTLITTQGLGHGRIINDEQTWQVIAAQLSMLKA